jgi:D-alanyl-D-alanine carboxypeptidase
MAELGRRLYFDFPQYYNLFSRNSTSAGIKTVQNTNRRLLDAYPGADGIKTGYTRAAGFALVSSAQRGNRRVIVSVIGAKSSASRNAEVARLMDLGFREMPATARAVPPAPLRIETAGVATPAAKPARAAPATAAMLPASRGSAASTRVADVEPAQARPVFAASARPMPRAIGLHTPIAQSNEIIAAAIAQVNSDLEVAQASRQPAGILARMGRPEPRPSGAVAAAPPSAGSASTFAVAAAPEPRQTSGDAAIVTVADHGEASTGGNDWGVQLGAFRSKGDAERQLLTTALQDVPHLSGGLRRVEAASVQGVTVYRAQFVGLDQQAAQQACQSITRQNATCETLAPGI